MTTPNEIILRNEAQQIVELCRKAKKGNIAERVVAIAQGIRWITEWEACKLTKQIKALGVVMKDRATRGGSNG